MLITDCYTTGAWKRRERLEMRQSGEKNGVFNKSDSGDGETDVVNEEH